MFAMGANGFGMCILIPFIRYAFTYTGIASSGGGEFLSDQITECSDFIEIGRLIAYPVAIDFAFNDTGTDSEFYYCCLDIGQVG
jgi:hypothetical protein